MTYQIKRTIVLIATGMILLISYLYYFLTTYQKSGVEILHNLKFWSNSILVFILISIVTTIIIQILFHILLAISIAIKEKTC